MCRVFPYCASSHFRRLVPPGLAAIACLTFARAQTQPLNPGPIIRLPTFTVTETRILPPTESWRYAQVPGFEILSEASDSTTEPLVHDFLLFHRAVEAVWPTVRMNADVATSVILCSSASRFAEFVPANVIPVAEQTLSLTIEDRENAAVVINLQNPGSMNATDMPDYSKQLLHDEYVHFVVGRIGPRTPTWLESALVKLFGAMVYDENEIGLPAISDPALEARKAYAPAKPGPNRPAGPPGPPLADDTAYETAVKAGNFMPFEQLFAADSDDSPDSPKAREAYEFVHLCLFGAPAEYRLAFLNFAYHASREPVTESLFKQCFNKGYGEMLAILWGYTGYASDRVFKIQDADGRPQAAIPALVLRKATDAESARMRGEAQRMAGRTEEARRSLIAPYVRGSRDPQLLAALGLAELGAGRDDRAEKFLGAAIDAKTTRARAYVEFARLRYNEALSKPSAPGSRLGNDQIASILQPLFEARSLKPPLPDLYELIADAWSHSSIEPTAGHLGAVDEGVLLFPYDMDLVYADAELQARIGRKDAAANLCDIGLQFAPDPAIQQRFRGLKDSLLPTAPNNPAR